MVLIVGGDLQQVELVLLKKRMEFFPDNDWLDLELDEIIDYIQNNSSKDIVAILIEAIQATNGDIYLNTDKLREIRDLCTEKIYVLS